MTSQCVWTATAPANIALIKYMGKRDDGLNHPVNDSLSYTLDNCLTKIELTLQEREPEGDSWAALHDESYPYKPQLNQQDQQRFIQHLRRIKKHFNAEECTFHIRSANNFPASCGIASSASSFAALTRCAAQALTELTHKALPTIDELAALSRLGSGSSCRSFYSPWAYWCADSNSVHTISLPCKKLLHNVLIVSERRKKISSSVAHRLVITSPIFEDRPGYAQARLTTLINALRHHDWKHAYQLCQSDWQQMHKMFHTCAQPFRYITFKSRLVIKYFENHWLIHNDGPLVTLDAGPNIHILFRKDQQKMRQECLNDMTKFGISYL